MTFLSGFASSFIDANKQKNAREQDQEDMQFKYKMDALVKLREKREARSEQENQIASQAKALAQQFGDDQFAPVAQQELKLGVKPETIQERMAKGYYVKNQDYTAPSQTLKVPSGVSMTPTTPSTLDPTGIAPTSVTKQLDAGMDSTDPKLKDRVDAVNSRIDQIDPTLRKQTLPVGDDGKTSTKDGSSPYMFKPSNEVKIGDLNDSYWRLHKAEQSGDPAQIREAQAQVEINQRVETERATMQARARGKNVDTYFSLNPDGTINTQLPGEMKPDGLYNVADPTNPQKVSGPVRRMSDDDVKTYNSLVNDFGKASKDYNTNAEAFVSALHSGQQMTQILKNDPEAATMSSRGLGLLQSLTGEAKAGYKSLTDLEANISAKVQSGKLDGIEKDIADHAKGLDSLLNQGVLSDANQQKAINAAKYNSLKMQTAYQIAQASATDGKVSNQDLANAMKVIGDTSDPRQIIPALNTQMQGAFLKLQSSQATLNRNPVVDDFEKRYGIKTGLKGKRIGDIIQGTELPDDQKQMLMQYLGNVTKEYAKGQAETAASIMTQPQPVQEQPARPRQGTPKVAPKQEDQSQDEPVTIKSQEEYSKLPKGSVYIAPDGKKRIKN